MRFADNTMLFHNAIFTKEICFQGDTDEGRSMTFITLVYETLKRYGKPLTFLGIWTQAQKFGYVDQLQSAGKTPMKTLEARVYLDLRDNQDTPLIQISKRPATFALKGMTLPNENEKSISTTEAKNAASSKNTGKKPKPRRKEPIVEKEECTTLLPQDWCTAKDGKGISEVVNMVLDIFSGGIIVTGTIGIIISGVMWMSAMDNASQIEAARRRIVSITIGIALFVLMDALIGLILPK